MDATTPMMPTRKIVAPTYRTRVTIPIDRDPTRYYKRETVPEYEEVIYRSSPQITNQQRIAPVRIPSGTAVRTPLRRHPVAVRTPR